LMFTEDTDTDAAAVAVTGNAEVNTVDLTADDKETKDSGSHLKTPHNKVIGQHTKPKNAPITDDAADDVANTSAGHGGSVHIGIPHDADDSASAETAAAVTAGEGSGLIRSDDPCNHNAVCSCSKSVYMFFSSGKEAQRPRPTPCEH